MDKDLVVVTGIDTQAMVKVLHIKGQVHAAHGTVLPQTVSKIWHSVYLHPEGNRGSRRVEKGFRGRGRTLTNEDGS